MPPAFSRVAARCRMLMLWPWLRLMCRSVAVSLSLVTYSQKSCPPTPARFMAEFLPVTTLADLIDQDGDDIVADYRAGAAGDPEPLASSFSRAFVHGWLNGAVDGGHRPKSAAQAMLAHAFVLGHGCGDAQTGDPDNFRLRIQ